MGTINAFNNAIADAKTAITLNAGTNTISIGSDASANTINLATGGAVKTLTVGSTNTTSSTAIKSGSGNIALNTGLTIDSTGRNYNTVQPCFLACLTNQLNNVTGDGTVYSPVINSEIFDQGSNYDNSTGVFTAPINGKYLFGGELLINGLTTSHTQCNIDFVTTSRTVIVYTVNTANTKIATYNSTAFPFTLMIDMVAGDTAYFKVAVYNGTKVVNLISGTTSAYYCDFWGSLIC